SLPPDERRNAAKYAGLTAIAMSIVPLNFPQSHELRYFMYWMICLVSLNLYLIAQPKNKQILGKWLQPRYMGMICAVFLTIAIIRTNAYYVKPAFISQQKYIEFGVKQEYLEQIKPNEKVCLVAAHMGEDVQAATVAALKYAYVYSPYFHPEIDYDYSIQTAFDSNSCGDLRIIPEGLPPRPPQTN
ncbi:MAG: hypothetical protein AAFQ23_10945, partial [Cyanobacteria bacterium J06623_1]